MKKVFLLIFAVLLAGAVMRTPLAEAYEEMGGAALDEKSGMSDKRNLKVTKEDMQNVMRKYIKTKEAENDGVFELGDTKEGKVRRLSFIDLHKGLGMSGTQHYSCADFKDLDSGEILDVDIYVDVTEEGLEVADAAVHKVDGEPQFIYGKKGGRMPADHDHMKDAMKGMMKEKVKEGGSQE